MPKVCRQVHNTVWFQVEEVPLPNLTEVGVNVMSLVWVVGVGLGGHGEGQWRSCPENFVASPQHRQRAVAVEVTTNDLVILVSTHCSVRVSALDARAIPSHNHKTPRVRVVPVCTECFQDKFLACQPSLQEGGVLGTGLVQYIRRSHCRWCFLGVCSILDVFQIFVVLEVKDLLHFQSTRTMSACAGGEVMIIVCCECLKSREHVLGVKVLDVERSWFVLGDSSVEGGTSERLPVCVKNDD